jgi:hypothetical protein
MNNDGSDPLLKSAIPGMNSKLNVAQNTENVLTHG